MAHAARALWLFAVGRRRCPGACENGGRADGEVLALLRQGLEGAPRTRYSTEIHGEFAAIDHALERLAPGDLCLVLVDQVEEALAHLQQRIASV